MGLPVKEKTIFKNSSVRSSHRRCSIRKGVLRNLAKFTGKHLRQSIFFNKVAEKLCHSCFPVIFAKFLRALFSQNTSQRLLLQCIKIWFWDHLKKKKNFLGKALKPPLFAVLSSDLKYFFNGKKNRLSSIVNEVIETIYLFIFLWRD